MSSDPIQDFFDRRFPSPGETKPWFTLAWKTIFIKKDGKPAFDSSAYQTTAELIEGAAGVSRAPHARDGYFCTAAFREADFRPPQALRRLMNVPTTKDCTSRSTSARRVATALPTRRWANMSACAW
jgi:hypothetical protein